MSSLGGAPASRRHGATTVDLAIAKASALLRVPARVMEDLVEWGAQPQAVGGGGRIPVGESATAN